MTVELGVTLPLSPPVTPMLAKPGASVVPDNPHGTLAYEPKWDGFRCIVFRDHDTVILQGRGGDDLGYAFPEVVDLVRTTMPQRVVLDGELVIVQGERLAFEALGQRLRPRSEEGRESMLARARDFPASFIGFDLLALGDTDLIEAAFADRRAALEDVFASVPVDVAPRAGAYLTPQTRDADVARQWFAAVEGAGLDGLIVKDLTDTYHPGARTLVKVKHARTLDAVVAGWRPHSAAGPDGPVVGSLLLGLWEGDRLHHVGVASSFTARRRIELTEELAEFAVADGQPHPWLDDVREGTRVPGAQHRWAKGRDSAWRPLRPELVAEVGYDQFEGDRLRNVAKFVRWRPDRSPSECGYDQVERSAPLPVSALLAGLR